MQTVRHLKIELSEEGAAAVVAYVEMMVTAENAMRDLKHAETRIKELEVQVNQLPAQLVENALMRGANRRATETVQYLSGQASELTKLCNEQRELLAKGAQEVEFLKGTIRDAEQHHDECRLRCGALEAILRRYVTLDDSELDSAVASEIELQTKLGKGEPSVA